ncbi:MAG: hypothetical protein KatS3mg114_1180 [Planctomycetaceae bacterium]|nr:MAG: hypothetical protein KatS3mg114_1180 [Planctomycetaceae bacterium]
MKWPVIFALLTGLFWGTYGPALGISRAAEHNPFKPYLMIGLAYLVWGVLGGYLGVTYTKATMSYTWQGGIWGFIAGSLGAFGALSLTLAMYSFQGMKPRPEIVMPIVFGTAVSVSALVSVWMTQADFNPWLYLGIVGMAVCIVIVAYNTPHAGPAHARSAASAPSSSAEPTNTPAGNH